MHILARHLRDLSSRSGVGLGSTWVTTTPGYAEAGVHAPHPEKHVSVIFGNASPGLNLVP